MGKEGGMLLFYLLFSAILFFIPSALVSAELATGWSKEGGGVYRWVKEAFGEGAGFVAIFLQWIQNVIWYPTVLAFLAGTLAYVFFSGHLAEDRLFNILVILIVYWGGTWINLRGMKASERLSIWGVGLGIFVPGLLIICLGLIWVLGGGRIEFLQNPQWIPDITKFSKIAFLAGVVLFFSGIEVTAVHAKDVSEPSRNYPKAIFISTAIILFLFILGAFSIATVLPRGDITLTAGIMQALDMMLSRFHLQALVPILGLLIVFGTIANVGAWIVGPSRGLLEAAKEGDLPKLFRHTNARGMPSYILITQGIVVSILSTAYLMMPTISSAYFMLSVLAVTLYLLMYLLMFASAIRLRYTKPHVKRAYNVPGGKIGMWCVAGLGILGSLFAILVGFFPPEQLQVGHPLVYVLFIACGVVLFVTIPVLILLARHKRLTKT